MGDEDGSCSVKQPLVEDEERSGVPYAGWGLIKKLPKSIWFIFGTEFCERYSYSAVKTILLIYLTDALLWSEQTATIIFHAFLFCSYLTPLFGANLADSWIGRYKTILFLSVFYVAGHALKSVGAIPMGGGEHLWQLTVFGLLLLALGSGGIKPCVSAFGGDQVPANHHEEREVYYQLFYFFINTGSLFSMVITPMTREKVDCFGDHCYALAFGIPAVLFVIAIVIFVAGTPLYKIEPPHGSVVTDFYRTIKLAFHNKAEYNQPVEKFVYHAFPEYPKCWLDDVDHALKGLLIMMPLPFFWMGFEQQGSSWLLQARQMNGDLGYFQIYPDQMPAVNSLLVLVFLALVANVIYPVCRRMRLLTTQLQRMGAGMFLGGLAFLAAFLLQIQINDKAAFATLADQEASVWLINSAPCSVRASASQDHGHMDIGPMETARFFFPEPASGLGMRVSPVECPPGVQSTDPELTFEMPDLGALETLFVVVYMDRELHLRQHHGFGSEQVSVKTETGVKIYNSAETEAILNIATSDGVQYFNIEPSSLTLQKPLPEGISSISVDIGGWSEQIEVSTKYRSLYMVTIVPDLHNQDERSYELKVITIHDADRVSILWQLPQYIILTLGEAMLAATAYDFAYSEVSMRLKSMMQSLLMLAIAYGNVLAGLLFAFLPPSRLVQFGVFTLLIFGAGILFAVVANNHTYRGDIIPSDDYEPLRDKTTGGYGGTDTPTH